MAIQSIPYVALLGLFFGSTLVVSRFSVGQFHPVTYIGLRLTLAGVAHAAIYAFASRRRWPTDVRLWRHASVLGVMGTAIPMITIISSLKYQSSGLTSLLLTTGPAMTVLLAHFFLDDERLTRLKGLGVVLALGGAVLLAVRGENGLSDVGRAAPIGYGLVALGMLSSSSMSIYARKNMSDMDSFDVASIRMFVAASVVMPLSLLTIGFDLSPVNSQGYLGLGYAALIGTFSGSMLAFFVIKQYGATSFAMTSYVIPIVAGIAGAIFLGEKITLFMMVGMVFIISGVAAINFGSASREEPAPSPDKKAYQVESIH